MCVTYSPFHFDNIFWCCGFPLTVSTIWKGQIWIVPGTIDPNED
jgi:hypothetical protein